jgi:hypothetical protein
VLEEAIRLRPELEDRRTVGNLLILEGMGAFARGDWERALALDEEGLGQYREARDAYGIAMCLIQIGFVTLARGDHERATRRSGKACAWRGAGSQAFIQYCLTGWQG